MSVKGGETNGYMGVLGLIRVWLDFDVSGFGILFGCLLFEILRSGLRSFIFRVLIFRA